MAGMEIINQLAAPLAQSAAVARQQTDEKAQQIHRAQTARKNAVAGSDTFEHQVESCEELNPIHDESKDARQQQPRQQNPKPDQPASAGDGEDAPPSIDVTA
jgi:hypothetical protein